MLHPQALAIIFFVGSFVIAIGFMATQGIGCMATQGNEEGESFTLKSLEIASQHIGILRLLLP